MKYSDIWKLGHIRVENSEQKAICNYCDLVPNSQAEFGKLTERGQLNAQVGKKKKTKKTNGRKIKPTLGGLMNGIYIRQHVVMCVNFRALQF